MHLRAPALTLMLMALAWLAEPPRAHGQVEAEQVRVAIERGVTYLRREQRVDGSWPEHPGVPSGITSLCTLALLNSGVPPDDPQVQSALNYLRKQQLSMTYGVALQTMVFCAAEPKTSQALVRRNVLWFEQHQNRTGPLKGAWGYPQAGGDNSNTQFALLALHEAQRIGVPVNNQTWQMALDYWQRTQNDDGSWGYKPGNSGTGSMTCAGIAALIITADKLNEGDARVEQGRVVCCRQQEDNTAVDPPHAWMARAFTVHSNPGMQGVQQWLLYYLYGVERVGRLTNQRFIGRHDWYREGAALLVKSQDELSGFWKGTGHAEDDTRVATSLSLLFLAKGRRPVLAAKVKHEPAGDWNHHRSDLANLTSYIET
ncbi:MAG: prenyltransferase/squalene oxidase repeat-containing protein, partial [Pirellulales bacterium]